MVRVRLRARARVPVVLEQLAHLALLTHREARALLDQPAEVGDLRLELRDRLLRARLVRARVRVRARVPVQVRVRVRVRVRGRFRVSP